MNETQKVLQYFMAVDIYRRGPETTLSEGPRAVRGLTWSEWWRKRYGESYRDYVERAKKEGIGDWAREYARGLNGKV